jgi:hypothetical protein
VHAHASRSSSCEWRRPPRRKYAFPTPHIFLIYFFNLLATLFNSAFRKQPTIRSVKRKRDISRGPVKCDGVGGLFPRDTQHEGEFPYREITTTINNFTSSSSKYLQFLISLAPQSHDIPISISSPLPLSPSLFRSRNTFTSRCHLTR